MKLFRLCDSNKGRCQKKTGLCGKISQAGGGSDPNPLLDVYLVYLKLWFFGEDQKFSWGSKIKNKPNFFL